MSVIYKTPQDAVLRQADADYSVANFITKADSPDLSVAVSTLAGRTVAHHSTRSDRAYYFLEAEAAAFELDGGEKITVEKGSVLFVPKNTRYTMTGRFRAVLVNAPAFDKALEG